VTAHIQARKWRRVFQQSPCWDHIYRGLNSSVKLREAVNMRNSRSFSTLVYPSRALQIRGCDARHCRARVRCAASFHHTSQSANPTCTSQRTVANITTHLLLCTTYSTTSALTNIVSIFSRLYSNSILRSPLSLVLHSYLTDIGICHISDRIPTSRAKPISISKSARTA